MSEIKKELSNLLTVDDVARLLKCSTRTVHKFKEKGILKFMKIGGLLRFRKEDVNAFILQHIENEV